MTHYFLLTRPISHNSALAEEVRRRNYTPIVTPVIEITAVTFVTPRKEVNGIIITSKNTIEAIKSCLPNTLKNAWIVGEDTARIFKSLMPEVNIEAFDNAAEFTAKVDLANYKGVIWYPHGSSITYTPPPLDHLISQVVYKSVEVKSLSAEAINILTQPEHSWSVALFSPRSAQIFCKLAGALQLKTKGNFYCLSEAVAAKVSLEYNQLSVAHRPNFTSLINLIPRYKAPMRKTYKLLLPIIAAFVAISIAWSILRDGKYQPIHQDTSQVEFKDNSNFNSSEEAEAHPLQESELLDPDKYTVDLPLPPTSKEITTISASELITSWQKIMQESSVIWPTPEQKGSNFIKKLLLVKYCPRDAHNLSNKLTLYLADHNWQEALKLSEEIAALTPALTSAISTWQAQLQQNMKAGK